MILNNLTAEATEIADRVNIILSQVSVKIHTANSERVILSFVLTDLSGNILIEWSPQVVEVGAVARPEERLAVENT